LNTHRGGKLHVTNVKYGYEGRRQNKVLAIDMSYVRSVKFSRIDRTPNNKIGRNQKKKQRV
jgi:hypothetical protein